MTTSRYGKTRPKKNWRGLGRKKTISAAIPIPKTTGTALTDASAATRARRGGVGTTKVKRTVHTATHESPRNGTTVALGPCGLRNSAAATPELPATSKT